MTLRINVNVKIENLRGYPEPIVESLRQLLSRSGGPLAAADPQRPGFYELADVNHAFYIYVWPAGQSSGDGPEASKVILLAHWTPST